MLNRLILAVLTSYFLGNINGAITMSTLLRGEDVRIHGSGNAGMANYTRNYGRRGSLAVLLIDAGKTVLACLVSAILLADSLGYTNGLMVGGMAVTVGHDFPGLLGFRGGKGVVCSVSVLLLADWKLALICIVIHLLTNVISGYASLSALVAGLAAVILVAVFHGNEPYVLWGMVLQVALMFFMHRSNIRRLLNGTESGVSLLKRGKK